MKRLQTIQELNQEISDSDKIVLVPTMGALHVGHFTLIKQAIEKAKQYGDNGKVAVSIFVNPIQFDRAVDLDSYPQPIEADLAHCERLGVDYAFTPDSSEIYHSDRSIHVSEDSLSSLLCGATRPGHFAGVCTVITKLFNLFQPAAAIFGLKDYQQLAIIKRLARDLNFRTEVMGGETVREESGLAMSSRNVGLTEASKAQAPAIRSAMLAAKAVYDRGETSADRILAAFRLHLAKHAPLSKIDYLECVCASTLQALKEVDKPAVIATAVFFKQVRLIDNIIL